jgi:hypothetical protein
MTRKLTRNCSLSLVAPFFAILIVLTAQASTPPLFSPAVTYDSGGSLPESVAIADVNGDGKPDLLVANFSSNAVGVLMGNGDGTFQKAVTYNSGGSGDEWVAFGGVKGDREPDMLVGYY